MAEEQQTTQQQQKEPNNKPREGRPPARVDRAAGRAKAAGEATVRRGAAIAVVTGETGAAIVAIGEIAAVGRMVLRKSTSTSSSPIRCIWTTRPTSW